jgi:hypothetical protein
VIDEQTKAPPLTHASTPAGSIMGMSGQTLFCSLKHLVDTYYYALVACC